MSNQDHARLQAGACFPALAASALFIAWSLIGSMSFFLIDERNYFRFGLACSRLSVSGGGSESSAHRAAREEQGLVEKEGGDGGYFKFDFCCGFEQ